MKEMKKNMSRDSFYVQGNTVRQAQVAPKPQPERQRSAEEESKYRYYLAVETERQHQFSFGYKVGFVAVVGLSLCVLGGYIKEEATLYKQANQIQKLQREKDALILENDMVETRMEDRVDLAELEKIAMEQYGMIRPAQYQLIEYENKQEGYVRQNENIPD